MSKNNTSGGNAKPAQQPIPPRPQPRPGIPDQPGIGGPLNKGQEPRPPRVPIIEKREK